MVPRGIAAYIGVWPTYMPFTYTFAPGGFVATGICARRLLIIVAQPLPITKRMARSRIASAGFAGETITYSALALDQIIGLDAGKFASHAVHELPHVLAIGLNRTKRQRIGNLVPRHVGELGI